MAHVGQEPALGLAGLFGLGTCPLQVVNHVQRGLSSLFEFLGPAGQFAVGLLCLLLGLNQFGHINYIQQDPVINAFATDGLNSKNHLGLTDAPLEDQCFAAWVGSEAVENRFDLVTGRARVDIPERTSNDLFPRPTDKAGEVVIDLNHPVFRVGEDHSLFHAEDHRRQLGIFPFGRFFGPLGIIPRPASLIGGAPLFGQPHLGHATPIGQVGSHGEKGRDDCHQAVGQPPVACNRAGNLRLRRGHRQAVLLRIQIDPRESNQFDYAAGVAVAVLGHPLLTILDLQVNLFFQNPIGFISRIAGGGMGLLFNVIPGAVEILRPGVVKNPALVVGDPAEAFLPDHRASQALGPEFVQVDTAPQHSGEPAVVVLKRHADPHHHLLRVDDAGLRLADKWLAGVAHLSELHPVCDVLALRRRGTSQDNVTGRIADRHVVDNVTVDPVMAVQQRLGTAALIANVAVGRQDEQIFPDLAKDFLNQRGDAPRRGQLALLERLGHSAFKVGQTPLQDDDYDNRHQGRQPDRG